MNDAPLVNPGDAVLAADHNALVHEVRRLRALVEIFAGKAGGLYQLGYTVTHTGITAGDVGANVGCTVRFWGRPDRDPVTVPPARVSRFLETSAAAILVPFVDGSLVVLKVIPPMDGEGEVIHIAEGERYISDPCVPD